MASSSMVRALVVVFIACLVPAASGTRMDERALTADERDREFRLSGSTIATIRAIDGAMERPPHGRRATFRVEPEGGAFAPMDLVLDAADPRAPGYQLLMQVDSGAIVPAKPGAARTMSGTVAGAAGSLVAGVMTDDGLVARIRFAETDPRHALGDHWLEPLRTRLPDAPVGAYVLYTNADVIPSFSLCGTEPVIHALDQVEIERPHRGEPIVPLAPRRGSSLATSEDGAMSVGGLSVDGGPVGHLFLAEIACDADFEYYLSFGQSVAAVEQRIIELTHLVNLQYTSEVEIRHDLTTILVRTTPNNPYTSSNSGQLLLQFRTEWLQNQQHIPHAVAMLFTGKNMGGILGQASTIGGICTTLRYCHGRTECCSSTACATDLYAHELGHLWGGFHCTCSSPPFTMNPSITCANTFQPTTTRPSLRAHRDTRTCLTLQLSPDVPLNDLCALPVDVPLGTTHFTTANATTTGPAFIEQCWQGVQREVWFRYTGQGLGFVTIDLCGSDFDTKIAVYKDSCPLGQVALRCNDDAGCSSDPLAARVTFPVAYGFQYLIEVGSPNGTVGNGVMTLSFEPFSETCAADINGNGTVDADDLGTLLASFGVSGQGLPGDLNADGKIDVFDLSVMLGSFGLACD